MQVPNAFIDDVPPQYRAPACGAPVEVTWNVPDALALAPFASMLAQLAGLHWHSFGSPGGKQRAPSGQIPRSEPSHCSVPFLMLSPQGNGVSVGVGVIVGVLVIVAVAVSVPVDVMVGVSVTVGVRVAVPVSVAVGVG